MRLSIKLFQKFLFTFVCLTAYDVALGQITINTPTTYSSSTTISENLIVNDTLIVQGDLTLSNKVVMTINAGGVVVIYRHLHTSNKITLDINSYLFVLGSITHTGASGNAEATISDNSQVYVFGDVSSDFDGTDLACPDGEYEQGTQNDCGHGNLDDFIRNQDDIPDNIISLVRPSADCEDLTISLDASGQASIQPADVHDGPLKANLTYTLSQSNFDCTDLGENTVTLTATNSGGLSDACTAVVTVEDNLKPIVSCPPDATASCIEAIPLPATTLAQFISRGGSVSDNCSINDMLTISSVDVTDKKDAINPCEVVRTYTITDEAGNVASCTQTFTITDATAPVIVDCPNSITDSADENCEKVISVTAPIDFTDGCGFGDVAVYHAYTIAGTLVEAAGDITGVAFPKGTTIVTWSFEDECGNIGTCEQAITIEDNTAPTASCPADQELDAGGNCSALLPDYTNSLIGLSDNCDADPTVTQRPAVNTEVFTNTEVWLIYADEDGNQDSCSFMVNLTNLAPLDISEVIYDGNQTGVGAVGSGQKPFITSTHPYEIDRNETTPEDYTYTWLVLDQSGTEVTPDISYPDSNPRNAVIAFSETHFTEGESYTIRVIKEQNTGNCSAVFELDIDLQETDFNSGVAPLGPTCQDGGTGIPTVVFWDVDFTGGVEPYAFDYSISDGTEGCTGQVSNLHTGDSESIVHTENCDGTYAVAISKAPGEPAVQIAFTFVSEAGVDKDFNLTIQSATDQFSITKQTINTDESDNVTLWGVPNTSDIETD